MARGGYWLRELEVSREKPFGASGRRRDHELEGRAVRGVELARREEVLGAERRPDVESRESRKVLELAEASGVLAVPRYRVRELALGRNHRCESGTKDERVGRRTSDGTMMAAWVKPQRPTSDSRLAGSPRFARSSSRISAPIRSTSTCSDRAPAETQEGRATWTLPSTGKERSIASCSPSCARRSTRATCLFARRSSI